MAYNETKKVFRPVSCLEADVETLAPVEGYVLFTSDTKKIYSCVNGEYVMMGGSSGVFYGNRQLTESEKLDETGIIIFNYPDHIEGKQTPGENDLILNIPDGGFYRVTDVNDGSFTTKRIAVSGSGTSGSGPGDSGNTNNGTIELKLVKPTSTSDSVIAGKDYYITFELVVKDSAGDLVANEGMATWYVNGTAIGTQTVKNGQNTFKIDSYLDTTKTSNKIQVAISINAGGASDLTASKTWYIKAIELGLTWDWEYSYDNYIKTPTFRIQFAPSGRVACTAYFKFDDGTILNQSISASEASGSKINSIEMDSLDYGAHTLELWLEATVNGETFETDHIQNKITFIYGSNQGIILTVPYYVSSATQYYTLNIPFLVYDPQNPTVEVSFIVNGNIENTQSYDTDLHYWPYTVKETGVQILEINAGTGASEIFEISVLPLELDVAEDTDYIFSLKANDFSGNNQIQEWSSKSGVTLTFSDNFDWDKGGLQTETLDDGTIQKYICVRQGTTMTINYNLFGIKPTNGRTFKICFKTANVYDYAAPVLNCYNDGIGLQMTAQQAVLSTPTYPNFNTQYYENTYLELETEIWKDVSDVDANIPGDRFLMFWIDGVPAGVKAYPTGEDFIQRSNPQPIIIGSDLCDIHIYTIKAYDYRLTENQHLNNFIMDAPNTTEMLERYNRNDILDNTGEISYELLVQKNPNCHAYVYEMDHMTTSKSDKVDGCKYFELYGDYNTEDNPYYQSDNAQVYVQGTSSAAYGVAAFNLRSKLKNLIDHNGESAEGWKVSENALPIDLACTKVNVASCENANNVVNVDIYNTYQPYHDAHRRKGEQYRDCMEFNTGVIFVKDNNTTVKYYNSSNKPDKAEYLKANVFLDTSNYTKKPYYKMYAIGNMGNDKKNSEIFHNIDNEKCCCLEIRDNQSAKHWMTVPVTLADVDEEDADGNITNYEFRYPDGNDKATTEMKQAWVDFVNWMASMHPKGATNLPLKRKNMNLTESSYVVNKYYIVNENGELEKATGNFDNNLTYFDLEPDTSKAVEDESDEKVVYSNYTFKGFDPPGYEGTVNPTGVSLKGTTIKTYSTTKSQTIPKLDDNGEYVYDDDGNYETEEVYTSVPYTHDTYEYRMARMLSECEDHLVMDSIVYHYLFIERHTMVDNVAKNAFWSTEDLIHWDLTKNYDNDTSDGNDNSGYLTFSYGIEIYDKKVKEDGSEGDAVFNAENSVWLAFINGLSEARSALYKQLQTKGAWSASNYLAAFEKHQSVIPERCWIYDYIRKYLRPRRLGLDNNTYLERLEGGRKVAQRTQYETYNEYYQNSKYIAGEVFNDSSSIDMRLNMKSDGEWDENTEIPVSYYIDCYSSGKFGGQTSQSGRLKRGEVYAYPIGKILQNPHDATCYIYGANMIQTISGLSEIYPSYASFAQASKLRELALGSDEEGYRNTYLTSLDISSNSMLQKALLQNIGQTTGLNNDLNLTKAVQLQELRMNGSTVKTLSLADSGVLEILYLNDLTTLTMSNLKKLKDVQVDDNIYNTMSYLYVQNCSGFDDISYQLALKAPIKNYTLTSFIWTINETNEDNFDIQNGSVVGLKVLDKLAKLNVDSTTNLVGTIVINTNCSIDEYDIYAKYIKLFPNVSITYTDIVIDRIAAYELKFLTEEGSEDIYYYTLGKPNETRTIEELISEEGPNGKAMVDPENRIGTINSYSFTGYWIGDDGNKYYRKDFESNSGGVCFDTIVPTTNYVFYPEYLTEITQHTVSFYDYDGNFLHSDKVSYGSTYAEAGGTMPNYLYKDGSKLGSLQRYGFKCWTNAKYEVGAGRNVEPFDFNTTIVKGPMSLYPYYEIENVEEVSTNIEYFTIKNGVISLKETNLQGKITIPDPSEFGEGVTASTIGSFSAGTEITHVFFKKDSTAYKSVDDYAFQASTSLVEIKLPSSITSIGQRAFSDCTNLVTINIESLTNLTNIKQYAFYSCVNLEIKSLPNSILTIGALAFTSCKKVVITSLPKNIQEIGTGAFQSSRVNIRNFGDWDSSQLKAIDETAFKDTGEKVNQMILGSSLEKIGNNAFLNYGYNNGKSNFDVYDRHLDGYIYVDLQNNETTYANMGFAVEVQTNYLGEWEE